MLDRGIQDPMNEDLADPLITGTPSEEAPSEDSE